MRAPRPDHRIRERALLRRRERRRRKIPAWERAALRKGRVRIADGSRGFRSIEIRGRVFRLGWGRVFQLPRRMLEALAEIEAHRRQRRLGFRPWWRR
jgi:hypothetical protein